MLKSFPDKPVSRKFGFDLGMPIDRYYIEKFLKVHERLIKGTVVEVSENTYTKKFGGKKVTKSLILSGDLETGEGIQSEAADCFICTQTLLCIFDVKKAAENCLKILKPGGTLLLTVPGVTQISKFDMDRWGHFWSFTDLSIKKLFAPLVSKKSLKVETFGNVLTSAAFLYGFPSEALSKSQLDKKGPDYQMLITAVCQKK